MKITSSNIESTELKTSNNYQDYFFVNCNIEIEIDIAGDTQQATLQTGHSYHLGDYSLPSNHLSVYGDCSSEVLEILDQHREQELDDPKCIEYINDQCDTSYTMEEIQDAYAELQSVIIDAQSLVEEAEQEAEQDLEMDKTVYVLEHFYENIEVDFQVYEKRQCDEPALLRFDTQESADEYIRDNENCEVISKERANSDFLEQL